MSEANAVLREVAGLHGRLLFPQAVDLARTGRYAEAEQWLRFLLEREPSAHAYCLLGKIYGQQARYDEAKAAFERALTIEPKHSEASSALRCVETLARPIPAASLRRWKLVSASALLTALLATGTGLMAPPKPVALPGVNPAEGIGPNTADLMQAFAALTNAIQPSRTLTDISLQPAVAGGRVAVAVRGTVPSVYLKKELERVLGQHAGVLKIDVSAVQISGRYTVRQRDTFSSMAAALCGRTAASKVLQAANQDAIPNRLRPGRSIVVTCE